MCICVSEFAFFCIYIFSFEYNLLNFLLICNVHVYLSHIPFIVCHEFIQNCLNETFMDYATCQWVSRVSTINVCHKRRDRSRGNLTMHKHANYSYKTMWSTIYYESQKRLNMLKSYFCFFWQMNKNLLNQLRVFFYIFHYLHSCGVCKIFKVYLSIYSLVM